MIPQGVEISGDPNEVWLIESTISKKPGWSPWPTELGRAALYDLEYCVEKMVYAFGVNWKRLSVHFRFRNVTTNEIIPGELFHD